MIFIKDNNVKASVKQGLIDSHPAALYPKPYLVKDDNDSRIIERINDALDDKNAHNIAITAPYDSGKSSLIKKIFEKREEYYPFYIRWWNKLGNKLNTCKLVKKMVISPRQIIKIKDYKIITLTNFFLQSDNNKNDSKDFYKEIEKSIIDQLILTDKKLPDSRISRIKEIKIRHLFVPYIMESIILTRLLNSKNFLNYMPNISFIINVILYICMLIMVWIINSYIGHLIPKLNATITLKVNNGSIELKDDGNLFNKYDDEIIYYFKKSKIRYVIFEDLDRFNYFGIFQNLRELNNRLIESDIPITFVYAIRDTIFTDNNKEYEANLDSSVQKTKFFDYVIPVFPLYSYFNSKSKILEDMKSDYYDRAFISDNGEVIVNQKYITGVGYYITDSRAISAIVSEMDIYLDKLKKSYMGTINYNKLFALIVYKNEYPDDFSKLQYVSEVKDVSKVGYLLRNIEQVRSKLSELITAELKDKKTKIIKEKVDISNEITDDVESLMKLRFNEALSNYNHDYVLINNKKYNIENVRDFYNIIFNNDVVIYPGTTFHRLEQSSFYKNEFERNLFMKYLNSEIGSINQMVKLLISEIKDKETEIKKIDDKVSHLSIGGLIELYEDYNLLDKIEESQLKKSILFIHENPLLRYLFLEGLIDQDIFEYISPSFFKELSQRDMQFVLSVLDHNVKNPTLNNQLNDPAKILQELKQFTSKLSDAYSSQILLELIKNDNDVESNRLISIAKNRDDVQFIVQCFELVDADISITLVKQVFSEWKLLLSKIFSDNYGIVEETKNRILDYIFDALCSEDDYLFKSLEEQKILENEHVMHRLWINKNKDYIFSHYTYQFGDLSKVFKSTDNKLDTLFSNGWYENNYSNFYFYMERNKSLIPSLNNNETLNNFILDNVDRYILNENKKISLLEIIFYLNLKNYGDSTIKSKLEMLIVISKSDIKLINDNDELLKNKISELIDIEKILSNEDIKNTYNQVFIDLIDKDLLISNIHLLSILKKHQDNLNDVILQELLKLEKTDDFDIDKSYSDLYYSIIGEWIQKSDNPKLIINKLNEDDSFNNIDLLKINNITDSDQKTALIGKLSDNFNYDNLRMLILSSIEFNNSEKIMILNTIINKFSKKFTFSDVSKFLFNDEATLINLIGDGNKFEESNIESDLEIKLKQFFGSINALSKNGKFLKRPELLKYFR